MNSVNSISIKIKNYSHKYEKPLFISSTPSNSTVISDFGLGESNVESQELPTFCENTSEKR